MCIRDSVEIVAFCDADAIVDENWLNELVEPMLHDSKIGATTGNRWFSPFDNSMGGMIRKLWNAAAVVQMQAYNIAWGGSMAVRRSTIERCGLKEVWANSFCEDTSLTTALNRQGQQLHRVPGLVIENRESTTVAQCREWIARQLTTVRLHHSGWPLVMGHGIATGVATMVTPVVTLLLFTTGYITEGRSLLFAWVFYQLVNYVLLWNIDRCNVRALANRKSSSSEASSGNRLGGMRALFGVQFLHPLALLDAITRKTIQWSGVTYGIEENNRIRTTRN